MTHEKGMPQDFCLEYKDTDKYFSQCLCDNTGCPRHGNCRECKKFHKLTAHDTTCQYMWHWKYGKDPEFLEK